MSGNSKPSSDIEKDPSKVDFTSEGNLRFYPDNPTHESHKQAFKHKQPSQYYDPCAEASQMSLNCLDRNNYDKKKCIPYFQAYRDCKKEFVRYRKKDQENGIW